MVFSIAIAYALYNVQSTKFEIAFNKQYYSNYHISNRKKFDYVYDISKWLRFF